MQREFNVQVVTQFPDVFKPGRLCYETAKVLPRLAKQVSVQSNFYLVVSAYRRMGNGAKLTSAYAARQFILAAIMYVDDTDLLHWTASPEATDKEIIALVQKETTQWGMLSQATGGILKSAKCSNYLLTYKFVKGRA